MRLGVSNRNRQGQRVCPALRQMQGVDIPSGVEHVSAKPLDMPVSWAL